MIWKEIKYGLRKNLIFIFIPLLMILLTDNQTISVSSFEKELNGNLYNMIIIPSLISNINEQVKMYILIIVFIAFYLPFKLFENDKEVLNMLLISPIKNSDVLYAKYFSICLVLGITTLFYGYKIKISFNLIIILFLIGLLYLSVGIVLGIYVTSKWSMIVTYPVSVFLLMVPSVLKKQYECIIESIQYIIQNKMLYIIFIIGVFAFDIVAFFIIKLIWMQKLRRERL